MPTLNDVSTTITPRSPRQARNSATLNPRSRRSSSESEVLTAKRTRLEQQLKIVTETRQADALNHEIEIINAHRDELDDRELEAMEQQSDAEQRLADLAGRPGCRGGDDRGGRRAARCGQGRRCTTRKPS